MRRRVFLRIILFLLLNCVIFVSLVAMQFSRGGNFSEKIGEMLVSGRYNLSGDAAGNADETGRRSLDGGVNVFFGGLEFRISSSEYIAIFENEAVFTLPDGSELSFNIQNSGEAPELRVWGKFPEPPAADEDPDDPPLNVSTIDIPFRAQRSSVIRNNDNEMFTISYNGNRYQFSRPMQSLDAGLLILSASTPAISYRIVTDKNEFVPADFIVPQAETAQAFDAELSLWTDRNFRLWGQMGSQTDEDTVVAWSGEAIRKGTYRTAVATVPVSFSTSPQRSWESAVYQFDRRIGVWQTAVRNVTRLEQEKSARIAQMLTDKDGNLFIEKGLIEYLAIRSLEPLMNDFLLFAEQLEPEDISLEMCPGILENYLDVDKWHPHAANPFVAFEEQVCEIIGDNVHRVGEGIFVFAQEEGRQSVADIEFNLRLGLALNEWGEKSGNDDWAGLGRSLVLSVISLGDANDAVPVSLTIDENGEITGSDGRIASTKLYRLLGTSEYLPHATVTGINGIWAWTAASSISIVQSNQQMDISVTFPVGETHYLMLRNISPFSLIQIHDMYWRQASDFESYYDSSGWFYFGTERTLVLKLRHRANVERIRVFLTAPRVEPPPTPPGENAE